MAWIALVPGLIAARVAGVIDAAEARVREAVPIARAIHPEPGIRV